MFYELEGHRAQKSSELGLHKWTQSIWEAGHPAPQLCSFRGFNFSFPSLFAVSWQQQTPLSSSTITTGFLVLQLGWYPGNTYNYGSSPSRWYLVTKDICSYGSYTDFFKKIFFKWFSCLHNSKVTAVTDLYHKPNDSRRVVQLSLNPAYGIADPKGKTAPF